MKRGREILLAIAVSLFVCSFVRAQDILYPLNIPPSDAKSGLSTLAQQTGIPLFYLNDDLGEGTTHGIIGNYAIIDALAVMLEGSGVKAFVNENGVLTVMVEENSLSAEGTEANEQTGNKLMVALSRMAKTIFPDEAAKVTTESPPFLRRNANLPNEITVTGSRLRAPGMISPVPVTSLNVREINAFEPSGTTAEQLDVLPQFFQTQTSQRGGGTLFGDAAGSYLNLRGMGKQRTLILFDGVRVVPSDRAGSVNVDTLPTALIRSVDVVTGGASAAYGADALAGVVNFSLNREYEGFELKSGTGVTERGDGNSWNFSVAAGMHVGDKIHIIGSMENREIEQIERQPDELENFNRIGWVTNPQWYPEAPAGIPQRLTLANVHSTIHSPAGLINQPDFAYDRYTFTEDGAAVRPFVAGDISSTGGPGSTWSQSGGPEAEIANLAFNGGAFGNNVVQRSFFSAIKYDFSDALEVFGQFLLGRSESSSNNRRGNPHLQSDTWFATIYQENPFLPEEIKTAMMDAELDSIRVDKLGQLRGVSNFYDNRDDRNVHMTTSTTLGFDSKLGKDWTLRGQYQYGEAKLTTAADNILRLDRLFLALDAVRDPETGALICNVQRYNPTPEQLQEAMRGKMVPSETGVREVESPIGLDNTIRDCSPLNIFGHGNVSQAAADYVVDDKVGRRYLDQKFAELLFSGPLGLKTMAGPVSFAGGMTWRDESFWQKSFPEELAHGPANVPELGIRGISVGFLGGSRSLHEFTSTSVAEGDFHVWELFSELNAPLWQSATNARYLSANVAFRSSDSSSSGRISSWKTGFEAAISSSLRFRYTRSRDVREPTFAEQFELGGGGGNFNDPEFSGANFETTVLRGGNSELEPEKANTSTFGIVYQSSNADPDDLKLSVDWYKIELESAIGQLGQQRIVDECFNNNSSSLCSLITRNTDGVVQRIVDAKLNIDAARTSGVDMELVYSRPLDLLPKFTESINVRMFAGYLIENSNTPYGGETFDYAGGLARPEWTTSITAMYRFAPFSVRLQQRYYDATTMDLNWVEGVDVDDNKIASQSITNASFTYSVVNNNSSWETTLSINNLFDRAPPIVPFFNQRTGTQQVNNNFDVFGRRYYLTFSLNY